MKVFLSWSGNRSKKTAETLSTWLRQVIQAVDTWISLDIEKGTRWNDKINKELEETKVGIICLDKSNLKNEWILFEAGALSKTSDAYVCIFLLDIKAANITPPLGQFQATVFSKEDIKKLVHTINNKIKSINEKGIPEKDLDELFEILWPKLEEKLNSIAEEKIDEDKNIKRDDREILEEILQIVRNSYRPLNFQTYFPGFSGSIGSGLDYLAQAAVDPSIVASANPSSPFVENLTSPPSVTEKNSEK